MKRYSIIIALMVLIVSCAKEEDTPVPVVTTSTSTVSTPYEGHSITDVWQHYYDVHYNASGIPTYQTGFTADYRYHASGRYESLPGSPGIGDEGTFTISGNNLTLDYTADNGTPTVWSGTYSIVGDTLRRFDNSYWSEKVYYRK